MCRKQLCIIALEQPLWTGGGYLNQVISAWESIGTQVCMIPGGKRFSGNYPVPIQKNLSSALAQAGACEDVILMTCGFMGPVSDLSDLLTRADSHKKELWQLTRQAPMWGIPREMWETLKKAQSFREVKEFLFSQEAAELYDTSELLDVTAVPLLDEPLLMVRDKKCPFFLHELFHRNYGDVITTTLGHQCQVFYRWLLRESGWNTDLLWDYLLSNCHQEEYFRNMHLTYVLPTDRSRRQWVDKHLENHSLALVMHLYYPDKLKESCSFAGRFPRQTHVIITTSDEEKKKKILEVFSGERFASLDVRVIANRGRDVSALLVGAADVFDTYDYVCFFHDKKTLQTRPGSLGMGFAYMLQENLFPTKDFVNNVLRTFAENPRVGLLSPPPPHHGDYYFTLGVKWGPNFENTRNLAKKLHFKAPIRENKMPLAPLGTCFWFRGKSLKPLSDHHWKYEEFPPEPNNTDGTLLHAIERIYPFAAVEAGYYPAFLLSNRYAALEYSSMRYYVRAYNEIAVKNGFMGYHRDMCQEMKRRLQNP